MKYFTTALLLLCTSFTIGCERIDNIEKRISALSTENIKLKESVDSLSKDLEKQRQTLSWMQFRLNAIDNYSAELNPTNEGFSIVKTKYGNIAVFCKNIEKYGNGSRIKLTFGNTLSAILSDIQVSISYGPAYSTDKNFVEWENSLKKKTFKMAENLNSGAWTTITVALPDYSPEQINYISIDLSPEGISLRTVGQ